MKLIVNKRLFEESHLLKMVLSLINVPIEETDEDGFIVCWSGEDIQEALSYLETPEALEAIVSGLPEYMRDYSRRFIDELLSKKGCN